MLVAGAWVLGLAIISCFPGHINRKLHQVEDLGLKCNIGSDIHIHISIYIFKWQVYFGTKFLKSIYEVSSKSLWKQYVWISKYFCTNFFYHPPPPLCYELSEVPAYISIGWQQFAYKIPGREWGMEPAFSRATCNLHTRWFFQRCLFSRPQV